jgi:hypothetical protein
MCLDDQIKEIEKLLGSEEFQSSEHRDILTNTLDTLREAQRGEWSDSFECRHHSLELALSCQ